MDAYGAKDKIDAYNVEDKLTHMCQKKSTHMKQVFFIPKKTDAARIILFFIGQTV